MGHIECKLSVENGSSESLKKSLVDYGDRLCKSISLDSVEKTKTIGYLKHKEIY